MAARKKSRRRHKTNPPPLTLREIRFAQHWAEHGNGTAAYKAAGYHFASENVAAQLARRLFRKVQIRAYIRELQSQAADAAMVTVERLAQGLSRTAYADRRSLFAKDGTLLPPHKWPDEIAACIVGIESEELIEWRKVKGRRKKVVIGVKHKVRLERRTEAMKILAQWRRMIGEDKAVSVSPDQRLIVVVSNEEAGEDGDATPAN